MSRAVRLAPRALNDLSSLVSYLVERNPRAAERAREALESALLSLAELADRGSPHPTLGAEFRELKVRFGRYGYAIQYRVSPDEVLVAQIRHVRQQSLAVGPDL